MSDIFNDESEKMRQNKMKFCIWQHKGTIMGEREWEEEVSHIYVNENWNKFHFITQTCERDSRILTLSKWNDGFLECINNFRGKKIFKWITKMIRLPAVEPSLKSSSGS